MRILHHLAVEAGGDFQLIEITDFIRRHQPRTEATCCVKVFAGGELRGLALVLTHAAIVVDAESGHVGECILPSDPTPGAADDQRNFTLEIERLRLQRPDHGLLVTHLCVGEAHKDGREALATAAGFFLMGFVIEPDT